MKKRILTGIKPTGYAHIGNYFGAIAPAIELSHNQDYESFYFIADYHALTTITTKQEMQEYTKNIACTWLACGLDPNKVVFYRQSDVPETFELNWILSNVTAKGLLNRAHAYKAKVDKNEQENQDKDFGINMGLYNYPVLMAADILLFGSDLVPVGQDQKQHIEIARDIANAFNSRYGKTFVVPDGYIGETTNTILGLDGRKMSKSYDNTIRLFTDEKTLQKTINKIVTDSRMPGESKPRDCTIAKIYRLFATEDQATEFEDELENGIGWGDAKKKLFAKANEVIAPMREKFNYYMSHYDEVEQILKQGAQKAREIARQFIEKTRKAIGV